MVNQMYPIIEKNGVEYVIDVSTILATFPPQYKAYSLLDKSLIHVPCGGNSYSNHFMTPIDFFEFLNGKTVQTTATHGNSTTVTYRNDPSQDVKPVIREMSRYFYEIVKPKSGRFAGFIQLAGPLKDVVCKQDGTGFEQIIDGEAAVSFTNEEILVIDRKL